MVEGNLLMIRIIGLAAVVMWPLVGLRAAPDLEITKTVDNPIPMNDEVVEFLIQVQNIGTDTAQDVHVQELLPPELTLPVGLGAFPSTGFYDASTGDWSVGSLAPGASANLLVPAMLDSATPPLCVVNTASTSHPDDFNRDNDADAAALRQPGIERCIDLSATFVTPLASGFSICSTEKQIDTLVEVTNEGPDTASDVVVWIDQSPPLATGIAFDSLACQISGSSVCNLPTLEPGESVILRVISNPLRNVLPETLTLTASALGLGTDYEPANDSDRREIVLPPFSECDFRIDVPDVGPIPPYCFIATAAYGSYLDPHVAVLRQFRDNYLLTNAPGRRFVKWYYSTSPPIAAAIAEHDSLRVATRLALTPLVYAVKYPMTACLLTVSIIGFLVWGRRRPARRRTSLQ